MTAGDGTPVDLREDGLLWLINRTCFHPRGFALGVSVDDAGKVDGFVLYGDGKEPWRYAVAEQLEDPTKAVDEDVMFAAIEAALARARAINAPGGANATVDG